MKREIIICFIAVVLLMAVYLNKARDDVKWLEQEIEIARNETDGMKVIMLGGSNMEDKENTNSCGYVIRNNRNELILVDGGLDVDADLVYKYIQELGNGQVKYWIITHAHKDHVGALIRLLNDTNYQFEIENLYYSFCDLEWYEQYDERGYESELAMINSLENSKIKNKIECYKNQEISMGNVKCDIIRIANPEVIDSDNGNEASMVFKLTAADVNKSMIFLGDAFLRVSDELMKDPEKLKADAVQMAHHGQNGVTQEVYKAILPKVCFFNCPRWLYENDAGNGYNSGFWKTIEVRSWMEEMGTTNLVAYEGDQVVHFSKDGIYEAIYVDT